jgi:head-tail adaptor
VEERVIPSALLRQNLTIRPRVGEGATGPVYSDPVTHAARIEPRRRQVRDAGGEVVISDAVAWLRPGAAVAVGDQAIVFGRILAVLAVADIQGLNRTEFLEVTIGESGGTGRPR